jgi:hypothetical protein
MSSGGGSSSDLFASSSDVDIHEGFKIVGIVLGFLFFLVVVRICCIGFIDLAILGDSGSLMKFFSELRRWFLPCWHPRTQPQQVPTAPIPGTAEPGVITIDQLLMGLNKQEKQELVASILTSKVREGSDGLVYPKAISSLGLTVFSRFPVFVSLTVGCIRGRHSNVEAQA